MIGDRFAATRWNNDKMLFKITLPWGSSTARKRPKTVIHLRGKEGFRWVVQPCLESVISCMQAPRRAMLTQGQGSEQNSIAAAQAEFEIRTELLPHKFVPPFKDKEEAPLLPVCLLCTWNPNSSSLLRAFLELCILKVCDTGPMLKSKYMKSISGCSLSYSLECFQVQELKCCYQMNMSLKYLHFLIIPKHL